MSEHEPTSPVPVVPVVPVVPEPVVPVVPEPVVPVVPVVPEPVVPVVPVVPVPVVPVVPVPVVPVVPVPVVPVVPVPVVPVAPVPVVPVVPSIDDITIVNHTLNETINGLGTVVTNQQGTNVLGNEITHTTMVTNAISDIQVEENLIGTVKEYDQTNASVLLNEIKMYAGKIKCEDFHGKGTIDDYTILFDAASRIANETKQMQLNINVEGFTEFGKAADDLSKLFTSFIVKLQTVSIIDDTAFLESILDALKKIYNLSEVFGRFKQTILATSTIQIPTSTHETKVVLEGVVDELGCAMKYINYFVSSEGPAPVDSQLSETEQSIIHTAVSTIDNWNTLCEQGVTISLDNNPDIKYMKEANINLKEKALVLKNATTKLKANKIWARFDINS